MIDVERFCDYFYKDSLIPVYIYENYNLISSYPNQTKLTNPPKDYLDILWQQSSSLSYLTTNFNSFLGIIRLKDAPKFQLVIGPVSNVSYTLDSLRLMYREYFVTESERNSFEIFYKNISKMTLSSFLTKLVFLNYSINQTSLVLSDILDINQPNNSFDISNEHTENIYINKENGSFNNSYNIEKQLIGLIESGNVDGLKSFTLNSTALHEGTLAQNSLRQAKNTTIVIITLATRAAIRGGLPTETAFQLSDLYIQKSEHLTTIESIYQLNYQAVYDFTHRVSNSQIPNTSDDMLQTAIQYIVKSTNIHLTASDVAKQMGFSRSYFTHRFKKELGFDLSAFILRCKLEDSKYLLTYTEKSISDISNYLCFSSQSHFQTAFKKQYHITPLEYRRNPSN